MQALVTTVATALAVAFSVSAPGQDPLPSPNRVPSVVKLPGTAEGGLKQDPKPAAGKQAPFVFEAGDVALLELIERCGAYLQFNIIVDGSELESTGRVRGGGRPRGRAAAKNEPAEESGLMVSLQLPVVTDRDGCEELLSSMLWSYGLSLVALDENKSVYEVLARQGPRKREIMSSAVRRTPEQVLARPMLRSYVATVVKLKHTNAQLANNALRPFYSFSGQYGDPDSLMIGNIGNKKAMLISGPQFMVASALKQVAEADVPETELSSLIEQRFAQVVKANESLRKRVESLEKRLHKPK